MSKYRILRDKGDGTPIEESPHGIFDNLMEAVSYFGVERMYALDEIKGRREDMIDGKYTYTQVEIRQESIPPGTVVNGAVVQDGYIIHRSEHLICRMWLEEITE